MDCRNCVRFSAAELADYKSKVTVTTDWTKYEDSLKRYFVERDIRQEYLEERETVKTKLFGLDGLYKKSRDYRRLELYETFATGVSVLAAAAGSSSVVKNPIRQQREQIYAELNAQLPAYGFKDIGEFRKFHP